MYYIKFLDDLYNVEAAQVERTTGTVGRQCSDTPFSAFCHACLVARVKKWKLNHLFSSSRNRTHKPVFSRQLLRFCATMVFLQILQFFFSRVSEVYVRNIRKDSKDRVENGRLPSYQFYRFLDVVSNRYMEKYYR